MEGGIYREPVKVNERALLREFMELCYLNGGMLIGEDDIDKPSYNVRCKIDGYGELSFSRKSKQKHVRVKDVSQSMRELLSTVPNP